ncbi:haloacid dehalogenase superfamily, subfamily IA, variant 3 with third motif having DD or ED [Methanolobus vulcani]|uniref:Haloacid dehalogenase superfamily, subfamily IA, variant 3 with third motif having DD or ED n=1 Tax=Methanolobus vulcani TaxID=38026 RepID=A0A7Z7FFE0_9EURY|nr:HAD family phosphatase [Methanolobus vulcani]SDG24823.1 haloacid dehalogenase superfamily, subfamily IA, variant 3 with third motif having DD or ED [Methanolobus vulcani]
MLKAVIFDMDGVLVDSMSDHAEAVQHIFDEIGVEMDKQDIYEREGERTVDIMRFLLEKGSADASRFNILDIVERYIAEFNRIAEFRVFEGMPECLLGLKDKFNLAVVSGSDKPIVQDIIQSEYPGIFRELVTADDVQRGKPDPDPYLKAIEMLGISSHEAIVIENAPMGVESAKKAGLCCLAVPTYLDAEKFHQADMVIENHTRLLEFLNELEPSYDCARLKL